MRILKAVLFIVFVPLISCSQNSKQHFSEITNVTIPASAQIIRNEYNKMGTGYAQVLEVNLNENAANKLLESIVKSHYYKQIDTILNPLGHKPLIQHGKYKGLWYRQKDGYLFYGTTLNDRDVVTATFDSIKKKATFGIFTD
jgi:hypothetical protein